MEVLFDERGNSFISFFQRSVRWTVSSRLGGGSPSRIKRDYAHSFQLIVNSYALTTRVHRYTCVRLRKRTCLIVQPTTTICNRDETLSRCRSIHHMILTSTYTHNDFFFCDEPSRFVDMAFLFIVYAPDYSANSVTR